jgi:hypothetical protein
MDAILNVKMRNSLVRSLLPAALFTSLTCAVEGASLHLHVLDSVSDMAIQAVTIMDQDGLPLGITDDWGMYWAP